MRYLGESFRTIETSPCHSLTRVVSAITAKTFAGVLSLLRRTIHVAHCFIPDNVSHSASDQTTDKVIRFKVDTTVTPRNACLIRSLCKRRPGKDDRLTWRHARFDYG